MSRKGVKQQAQKEPWLTRTQKIIATVVSALVLIGMIWNYGAKADSRYAKESELEQVKVDVALLGKAFQSEQIDRSISNKQDILLKINMRLREKISLKEKIQLEEVKRQLEIEIDKLKDKQKKLAE